jgi:hypothetical protein
MGFAKLDVAVKPRRASPTTGNQAKSDQPRSVIPHRTARAREV